MDRPHWYPKGKMEKPFLPNETLDKIDLAFGAANRIETLLPPVEDIPESAANNKWVDFFGDMFYSGLESLSLIPREGIDPEKAWTHLRCITGSFAPKHEYKQAAFAFLADLWFEDVKWERKK